MATLAPWHMAGLIMGAWFFATAGGNFVAGQISAMTGAENAESGEAAKDLFLEVWSTVGWIAIGIGIVVLVLSPFVKKLMHLESLRDHDVGTLEGQSQAGIEAQEAGMHPATNPLGPGDEPHRG